MYVQCCCVFMTDNDRPQPSAKRTTLKVTLKTMQTQPGIHANYLIQTHWQENMWVKTWVRMLSSHFQFWPSARPQQQRGCIKNLSVEVRVNKHIKLSKEIVSTCQTFTGLTGWEGHIHSEVFYVWGHLPLYSMKSSRCTSIRWSTLKSEKGSDVFAHKFQVIK